LFHFPHFKPDYSPDLLLSHNYITHFMILKRDLLNRIGGFRSEYDGAQDYDISLRAMDKATCICHIRKVLYHWRIHSHSSSNAKKTRMICTDKGEKAISEYLKKKHVNGYVTKAEHRNFYQIEYTLPNSYLISIIIPFKDHPVLLDRCLDALYSKTSYPFFEVILVNNLSVLPETKGIIQKWTKKHQNIRILDYPFSFNYSAINNAAVSYAKGEFIVLMNNDIEIISPNWLQDLLEHAQREEVGAVGGKLYYPNNSIQHAGIGIGLAGLAGHPYKGYSRNSEGYLNNLLITRNVSAVTGALLMIKKDKFLEIGSLDEINLKIAFNDVDFCLRLLERGYINIFTPKCQATHAESISRGYEDTPEKRARFQKEVEYCLNRHKKILNAGDPWYNPNFSLNNEKVRFTLKPQNKNIFGVFRRGKNGRMYYEPIMGIDT
jgi:O-antigen biosynthesis protein